MLPHLPSHLSKWVLGHPQSKPGGPSDAATSCSPPNSSPQPLQPKPPQAPCAQLRGPDGSPWPPPPPSHLPPAAGANVAPHFSESLVSKGPDPLLP